jgi:hypothetical protein
MSTMWTGRAAQVAADDGGDTPMPTVRATVLAAASALGRLLRRAAISP